MDNNEIQTILMNALSLKEVYVSGDGKHFNIIVIDNMFHGMNCVKKQQIIYEPLVEYITNNRIHALSIKVYTPYEWELYCKLNNFS